MKTLLFGVLLCACTFLTSCTKNDDNNAPSTLQVNTTLSSGTWRVTYYWDTDHDETSNFAGYAFTFGSSNILTAAKVGSTLTGTWVTGSDDSKTKLIVAFSSPSNFAEISDDWEVVERTDTKIRLQDVSGGGSGTDYLTFERN